jgi:hypothetical protein
MKHLAILLLLSIPALAPAQEIQHWTEDDRKLLLENLVRSRDELAKEVEGLSKKQAAFKESPDRWSINQVVEHLAFFEMIFQREIARGLNIKPQTEFNKDVRPDTYYSDFIMEEAVHITTEYTKPFTYTVPLGLNDTKNNLSWFMKMRAESIEHVKTTTADLRLFFRNAGVQNIHQTYLYVFGHVDRHLRQIRKIKQHQNYPK